MPRLLIISPHFPPVNAPDHQRVRMALPYFREFGWEVTVLAVEPEHVEGALLEPLLEETVPSQIEVIRTGALPILWTRKLGLGSLALRSYFQVRKAGDWLLRSAQFQAVFFSTTQFPIMALGPRWRKRFGIPYVLDFQDPWISDYYSSRKADHPPGGRFKYRLAQTQARWLEPNVVNHSSHVISVSPAYKADLCSRYAGLSESAVTILPFGASETDFDRLSPLKRPMSVRTSTDANQHWAYVGVVPSAMNFTLRCFFKALAQACEEIPGFRARICLHFLGTSYAPVGSAKPSIAPIAAEFGVEDMVVERTARLPYFVALQCLRDADALIIPGSDDPGYTASKIYPNILAKKPLLAIFHEQSSVVEVLRKTNAGTVVTFRNGDAVETVAARITEEWFRRMPPPAPQTDWAAFAPYTAREMTRKLCTVFDRVTNA